MRVQVTDLVDRPGATRVLDRVVEVDEVGDDPWGPAEGLLDDEIELSLTLESVREGVFVTGDVLWTVRPSCARCLRATELERAAAVAELFADPAVADAGEQVDEGYELVDDRTAIDVERLLHDLVVLDLPGSVRCERPDCEAPDVEGVEVLDEDEAREAADDAPDPRWAKLAELDLDG